MSQTAGSRWKVGNPDIPTPAPALSTTPAPSPAPAPVPPTTGVFVCENPHICTRISGGLGDVGLRFHRAPPGAEGRFPPAALASASRDAPSKREGISHVKESQCDDRELRWRAIPAPVRPPPGPLRPAPPGPRPPSHPCTTIFCMFSLRVKKAPAICHSGHAAGASPRPSTPPPRRINAYYHRKWQKSLRCRVGEGTTWPRGGRGRRASRGSIAVSKRRINRFWLRARRVLRGEKCRPDI